MALLTARWELINMEKLYMVHDLISDMYFSEVAGCLRQEKKHNAYVYDKKHANIIKRDALIETMEIMRLESIPDKLKMSVDLELEEIDVMDVPIAEYVLNKSWSARVANGFPVMEALRLCKLEQVRRFNDYVTFDTHTPSHQYRYLTETF